MTNVWPGTSASRICSPQSELKVIVLYRFGFWPCQDLNTHLGAISKAENKSCWDLIVIGRLREFCLHILSEISHQTQSESQSETNNQLTRISCCNSSSHFKLQVVDAMTFQTKYRKAPFFLKRSFYPLKT